MTTGPGLPPPTGAPSISTTGITKAEAEVMKASSAALRLGHGEGALLDLHLRLAGKAQHRGAGDAVQDVGAKLAGDDAACP